MKKRCSKCRKVKEIASFFKNKSTADGLDHYCRECNKERMKIYFKTEKGKIVMKRAIKKYLVKYRMNKAK